MKKLQNLLAIAALSILTLTLVTGCGASKKQLSEVREEMNFVENRALDAQSKADANAETLAKLIKEFEALKNQANYNSANNSANSKALQGLSNWSEEAKKALAELKATDARHSAEIAKLKHYLGIFDRNMVKAGVKSVDKSKGIDVGNFRKGSATLTSHMKGSLKSAAIRLADVVKTNKEAGEDTSIGVIFEGFTDQDGDETENKILALKRAKAVKVYLESLLEKTGFKKTTYSVTGGGETDLGGVTDAIDRYVKVRWTFTTEPLPTPKPAAAPATSTP